MILKRSPPDSYKTLDPLISNPFAINSIGMDIRISMSTDKRIKYWKIKKIVPFISHLAQFSHSVHTAWE